MMLQHKNTKKKMNLLCQKDLLMGYSHYRVLSVDMHFIDKTTYTMIMNLNPLYLTLYLIEKPFNIFANRADPDQAALVRTA